MLLNWVRTASALAVGSRSAAATATRNGRMNVHLQSSPSPGFVRLCQPNRRDATAFSDIPEMLWGWGPEMPARRFRHRTCSFPAVDSPFGIDRVRGYPKRGQDTRRLKLKPMVGLERLALTAPGNTEKRWHMRSISV